MSYRAMRLAKVDGAGMGMPDFIRAPEAASQTFKEGTPLALSSGYAQASAFGGSELVYGVSAEAGHNLAAAGTSEDLSEATPPNQSSAVTTPVGAWIRDGSVGVYKANGSNIFSVKLKSGQSFSQALVVPGTRYELVKDGTTGYWYVDSTSTGSNDEHCVEIIEEDTAADDFDDHDGVMVKFHASARAW